MKPSSDLQEVALSSIIHDSYLLSLTKDMMEDSYFENINYRVIYQGLLNYYEKYDESPDEKELLISIEDVYQSELGDLDEIKSDAKKLFEDDDINEDFAIDKLTAFIRRNNVERAIKDLIPKIKEGKDEGIELIADDLINSIQVNLSTSDIFHLDDVTKLGELRDEAVGDETNPMIIKSVLPSINKNLLYKGYKPGDVILVVAAPGVGKTSYCINEGASASKQGYNVLHIFIGDMNEYDGFIRYGASFSGKSQDRIVKLDKKQQAKFVEKYNMNGEFSRVNLLAYPAESLTIDQLIETVEKTQDREDKHFNMIVVDYADNLVAENSMMYKSGGKIYNKLSYLANNNHSTVIVASQPKINYWDHEIIPKEGAAESSKKQHVIDVMLTLGRPSKDSDLMTGFLAKVRRGNDGRIIRAETDWGRCRIRQISEKDYCELKVGEE